ncbi:MAG: hypothetical protein K2I53_03205, partial [Lachnospiraceae bacterium]|nr:hypothetical protein [Lachnospiraceae bacterium]
MSILKYIRVRLNDHFIKNNALIAGELQRHYKVYGRPSSAVKRAGLILQLSVQCLFLKKGTAYKKQKKFERQIYPESCLNQQVSKYNLLKKIKNSKIIIFDLWNVLLYSSLETWQYAALLEVMSGRPGISKCADIKRLLDGDEVLQKCLEEICIDFCLNNEYMHDIWECANIMGKSVFLYNNSDFDEVFVRKIAESFAYTGDIYHGDFDKGLYITADARRKKGIIYKNVNELGKY